VPTASIAVRGTREQVVPIPQDPACAPSRVVPAEAKVVVNVVSLGVLASVRLLRRDGERWVCEGSVMDGRVGRTGVHELAARVGGDGSTPGGVFGIGTMTAPNGDTFQFFGNGTDPGVPGSWHQVQPNDCWWADPGTSAYNTLVTQPAASCRGENEFLSKNVQTYSRAALIDANMGPARIGDDPAETPRAAAIFLHRHGYTSAGVPKPTSGCVSLAEADLAFVLTRLVPGEAWFVIS
jgi:L,D-peptidoglycan transpeptidase YkuD (ErfK/YbiS/YcfS/YnhG family)